MGCVAPRDLRDMMVEQGIEFASAAQVGEWIGCSPVEVAHRLRGARQAREMVCVTRRGWVPAVDGRTDPQALMEPILFALHPFRGCDAKATVACELLDPGPHRPPTLDAETLASVAMLYPPTTRQRVGFLLQEMAEHVGSDFDLDPLEATLPSSTRTVEFEYGPDRSEPPIKHDGRWSVRQWYEMWPDV